jgi:hypothetical protein
MECHGYRLTLPRAFARPSLEVRAPPLRFRWRLIDGRMAFVMDDEHDSPRDLRKA